MSPQLSLLPGAPAQISRERLPLELIDGFDQAAPSAKLRELIARLGLLQPVVVVAKRSGRYAVVEGRRRCKAIAQLAQDRLLPAQVDALVLGSPDTGRAEVRGGLALALHASRRSSPASELQAIEAILSADVADGEVATVKQIAAQTGMSVPTVRRRLKLRSLAPALREALDQGRITASVAEAATRLPEREQHALADQLAAQDRLTLTEVRDVARQQRAHASAELPGELFSEREVPWPVIVRGHLVAALEAIPAEERDGPLAEILATVLAQAERA